MSTQEKLEQVRFAFWCTVILCIIMLGLVALLAVQRDTARDQRAQARHQLAQIEHLCNCQVAITPAKPHLQYRSPK